MDKAQIARMIDHTILKAEATEKEVLKLCKEAVEYNFASVCINPSMVPVAATALEGFRQKGSMPLPKTRTAESHRADRPTQVPIFRRTVSSGSACFPYDVPMSP